MRRTLLIVMLAIATALVGAPASRAATHERTAAHELRAYASFRIREGASVTRLYVYAVTGDVKSDWESEAPVPAMEYGFSQRDRRTGETLHAGWGLVPIDAEAAVVDPKLAWANLHTTVTAFDEVTGRSLAFVVDASWTAWGERIDLRNREVIALPEGRQLLTSHWCWRAQSTATADIRIGRDTFTDRQTSDSQVFSVDDTLSLLTKG